MLYGITKFHNRESQDYYSLDFYFLFDNVLTIIYQWCIIYETKGYKKKNVVTESKLRF